MKGIPPPKAWNRGRDSVQVACRGAARRKVRRGRASDYNDTSYKFSLELSQLKCYREKNIYMVGIFSLYLQNGGYKIAREMFSSNMIASNAP